MRPLKKVGHEHSRRMRCCLNWTTGVTITSSLNRPVINIDWFS
jgi:hypothetical protein